MTRNETEARSENTREKKVRRTTFEEPNWLDIPESVIRKFDKEDMALRWIRISLRGMEDVQNIGKRQSEGWEFIDSSEVPEMIASSIVQENGRATGAVCRGDLALAKMPKELADSRQEFYENKSREMMEATNANLMRNNTSTMPIQNESRTQVTRGRVTRFQD